mmetsp:Transcript_27900/g.64631  ORF Transcript_27900/g.64631 Transcript_27900/m.64631 type:complete len:297 (+) Transcript_27900:300-1190(+)
MPSRPIVSTTEPERNHLSAMDCWGVARWEAVPMAAGPPKRPQDRYPSRFVSAGPLADPLPPFSACDFVAAILLDLDSVVVVVSSKQTAAAVPSRKRMLMLLYDERMAWEPPPWGMVVPSSVVVVIVVVAATMVVISKEIPWQQQLPLVQQRQQLVVVVVAAAVAVVPIVVLAFRVGQCVPTWPATTPESFPVPHLVWSVPIVIAPLRSDPFEPIDWKIPPDCDSTGSNAWSHPVIVASCPPDRPCPTSVPFASLPATTPCGTIRVGDPPFPPGVPPVCSASVRKTSAPASPFVSVT